MSGHPPVIIVDEDDRVLGTKDIVAAYADNDIVRIARIFLLNKQGQVLLQKRSANIRRWPNTWDQSAAGHVDAGEDYDQAAYREMREELGITSDMVLNRVDYYFVEERLDDNSTSKRFNATYIGRYDGEFNPDPEEVSEVKWVTLAELEDMIANQTEICTPGLISSYNNAEAAIHKAASVVK